MSHRHLQRMLVWMLLFEMKMIVIVKKTVTVIAIVVSEDGGIVKKVMGKVERNELINCWMRMRSKALSLHFYSLACLLLLICFDCDSCSDFI